MTHRPIRPRTTVATALLGAATFVATALPAPLTAQSDVAFSPEVYASRRAKLVALAENAPVVVPGGYRVHSEEKPEPNFWYLTGVESPLAVLVVVPSPEGLREVLFLPERFQFAGAQFPTADPRFRNATWNRPIRRLAPGPEAAAATGIAETYPIDELADRLPNLVGSAPVVYLAESGGDFYAPPGIETPRSIEQQLDAGIAALLRDRTVKDATPLIERMRLVKDEYEIEALRKAAQISADGMIAAMRAIRPGRNDLEIAGLMEAVWKQNGSPRASFGPIVSSGPAAMSLYTLKAENYNATDHVMEAGQLVFIDYGAAEWATYTSDVCRTFPVLGRFTIDQRRLYEIVLEAQEAALAEIRPGVMMRDVIRAAARVFHERGLARYEDIDAMGEDRVWGIMPSPTYWIDQDAPLTDYSGARGTGVRDLGHHIGLEALDSRDYSMPLEPGMVFTVEPKLYVPEDDVAVMIEDMILVTEDGYENLSAGAPRAADEIERLMIEARTSFAGWSNAPPAGRAVRGGAAVGRGTGVRRSSGDGLGGPVRVRGGKGGGIGEGILRGRGGRKGGVLKGEGILEGRPRKPSGGGG